MERRNEIAHGMVVLLNKRGHFLVPATHKRKQADNFFVIANRLTSEELENDPFLLGGHKYRYTSDQILEFATQSSRFSVVTFHFSIELRKPKEQ